MKVYNSVFVIQNRDSGENIIFIDGIRMRNVCGFGVLSPKNSNLSTISIDFETDDYTIEIEPSESDDTITELKDEVARLKKENERLQNIIKNYKQKYTTGDSTWWIYCNRGC